MKTEEKALIMGKKIECWLGIFILIPPILGVISFILCLFDNDGEFANMSNLSINWTNDYSANGGGGMSAAPIFLALMALAGVFLIKDSMKYLFMSTEGKKEVASEAHKTEE